MEFRMKTRILFVIITWLIASSTVYAACQIEMDQSKNEGPFYLRTNVGQVPNQSDELYGYKLVASWTQIANNEPKAKNPRIYFYNKNSCDIVKIVELYPKDLFIQVGSEYYGASFNKQAGLIYVTSLSVGIYPNETRYYNYTEIYSYEDFSLLNRLEGKTPLARAEITQDGNQVIGFDHVITESDGLKDSMGSHVVVWSSDDFQEIKRSELIDKSDFEDLGIQPSGHEIVIRYFEKQWFKEKGYDLDFKDQYVIQLSGNDAEGNARAVEYTLGGMPLLTLWRENGKTIRGYPSDYEKKFNIKINPIKFNDVRPEKGKPQLETIKKTINPEPTPVIEPYVRPPSVEEQIKKNRAAKEAREQQNE